MKHEYNLFDITTYSKLRLSCIYKLTTPCNGLFYIGSTIDFSKRMKDHRNDLKSSRHVAKHFQNVINKYGEKCITEILEEVPKNELLVKEKYYIDLYNPKYNSIKDPTTQINNSSTSKIVYQYDLAGNYLKQWNSLNEVERELLVQPNQALDKEFRSGGGYQWRSYKVEKINPYQTNQGVRGIIHIYDIFGKYLESLNMNEIKDKYYPNLKINQVRNKINRLISSSKSVNKIRFSKELVNQLNNDINKTHIKNYIIIQYDLDMNFIDIHDSIPKASKLLGLTSIHDNLIGKTKCVNNQYIFKILDGSFIQ